MTCRITGEAQVLIQVRLTLKSQVYCPLGGCGNLTATAGCDQPQGKKNTTKQNLFAVQQWEPEGPESVKARDSRLFGHLARRHLNVIKERPT